MIICDLCALRKGGVSQCIIDLHDPGVDARLWLCELCRVKLLDKVNQAVKVLTTADAIKLLTSI